MALSFAFDANQETPASVARRRAIADMLAGRIGRAQNVGEGLGDLFSGIAGGFMNYRANKGEAAGQAQADKLFGSLALTSPSQAPQMGGGYDMASPAPTPSLSQPPAPKLDFGGYSGIPASKSAAASALLQKPAVPGGSALPASFLASVDKTEGAGGYDTLYGHANKKGPFAGVSVSNMTVGDVMRFTDPNGAYAGHVRGQIGRVATPVGRYQIVGQTLRNAVRELGIDPKAKFDASVQDRVALHLAKRRISGIGSMGGKIAALREEWHGFKNVPNAQMARIVADLEAGRASPATVQVAGKYPLPSGAENWPDANKQFYQGLMGFDKQPVQVASNDAAQSFQAAAPQAAPTPTQQPMVQPANSSGPDMNDLLKAMASPWLKPEQRQVLQAVYEQQMQQQDPMRQLQMQKIKTEIENAGEGDVVAVGGRLVNRKTGQVVYDPPQDLNDQNEFGLNPFMARDKDGNLVPYQLSKSGTLKRVELPEGQTPAPQLQYLDTGTGFNPVEKRGGTVPEAIAPIAKDVAGEAAQTAIGKEQGTAQGQLPAARITADQTIAKIDELLNDKNLGGISGWQAWLPDSALAVTNGAGTLGLRRRVEQLKGSAFLEAYNGLRGGGQITEVEGKKAEDALARLDTAQSDADYVQALKDFRDAVEQGYAKLAAKASGVVPPQTVKPPPAPTGDDNPPLTGAKKAPDGKWYVPDPNRPGKYLEVQPNG